MSLIVNDVAKSLGGRQLFTSVGFRIDPGTKAALIGRNGTGKSTLMRIFAGIEEADVGAVHRPMRVGLLQQQAQSDARSVLESVTPPELALAREQLARAERRLSEPTSANLHAYAEAEELFRTLGGYEFPSRAEATLGGLGLDSKKATDRLSGGEQRRAMLAALLLSPADLLLLDEPTNHLDIQSRKWLEAWLLGSNATVLVVSHDRAFLDNTVTEVLELEHGKLRQYPGNYTRAMDVKRLERAAHERAYAAQERRKEALRAEMARLASMGRSAGQFNYKRAGNTSMLLAKNKAESVSGTFARRAKALEARLERMGGPKPFEDRLTVKIPLPEVPVGPEEVLVLDGFGLERGGRWLCRDMDATLRRGEKVALVGPNGCGKSSLLCAILGRMPHEGSVRRGWGLSLFSALQNGEELAEFETVEEAVGGAQPALRRQDLYHLLGRLGLPGPDRTVASLSGGQRRRLALARLTVTRASLLVLDEPTNNLDLEAVEALEELLAHYPGSMLFTSHDRRLIERVATRVWRWEEEGILLTP